MVTKTNGRKPQADQTAQAISLPRLNIQTMIIRLIGVSPLITHAWSEKAKGMMRDKQAKKAKQGREIRDPQAEFESAMYLMPDGKTPALPTICFKCSAVDACSHVEGVTKVEARGAFHLLGERVPIESPHAPVMREDMVRVGMGSADLRYRPEWSDWSVTLRVQFNASVLSAEQIVNLFNTAGFCMGVGEWRPQKDGSNGMFRVANEND